MGWFKKSKIRKDKNPQSGANSFSSSSAQSHESSQSDAHVPTVNLTEQRLLDWRAVPPGVNNGNNGGDGGAGNVAGASGIVNGGGGKLPSASPTMSNNSNINARNNNNINGNTINNVPTTPLAMNGSSNVLSSKTKSWKNNSSSLSSTPPRNSSSGTSHHHHHHHHSSSSSSSTSPNQLILLIERGQWSMASQRAISHESEVKQLVKLRKTTKNNAGPSSGPPPVNSSSANTDAEVAASPGIGGIGLGSSSSSVAAGLPRAGGGFAAVVVSGSGNSGRKNRNLQISNVKCKALHHACQKLRSVHTTIYSNKNAPTVDHPPIGDNNNNNNNNNNTRRIIEDDEYIEACKCILTLIRIHPEACKDRESRHGCLPLHLCVFSMCATPPPPPPPQHHHHHHHRAASSSSSSGVVVVAGEGKTSDRGRRGEVEGEGGMIASHGSARGEGGSGRRRLPPAGPVSSGRSGSNNNNAAAAAAPNVANKGHHRNIPSTSSADFSLGNISEMIREESEHQQALTEHRESTKNNNGNGVEAAAGRTTTTATGSSTPVMTMATEKIYEGIDNIERLLIGLESKYEMKEEKKKRDKKKAAAAANTSEKGEDNGMDSSNTILTANAPLDRLEERSRETDSHSSPAQGSSNSSSGVSADERTGAAVGSPSAGGASAVRGNDSSGGGGISRTAAGGVSLREGAADDIETAVPLHGDMPSSSREQQQQQQPTYEDLQRRYLQINTQRRDDYSARVLNALLDAWPKSVKTSSEGGRLPLHMACFGKATVKVMETVLKAYPDAARQRNHDGFLPIHIAAHWGVSHADIAPLILRAYPDGAVGRNRWERTPIEEALGMAGENGRDHQLSLVWSLRRHPTYWIHNDIGTMLLPRNVRTAPWRMVDVGDAVPNEEGGDGGGGGGGMSISTMERRVISRSAVDVDEVGSSDEEDEGVEVQMTPASSSSSGPNTDDPEYIHALAESTDLSLLITKDKHWSAAAVRCRLFPHEAREAMEVKVRGAYTAKITPLHYACENKPTVEVIQTLIEANGPALERRQEPGGQLPLHAACTWGASPDVVRALLAAHPACAEMKDFLSNLPLHCACYSGADTVVFEALLRVYPQSVWPRNHQGSSAVDIVRRLAHPNRREVLALLESTMGRLLERGAAGEVDGGGDPEEGMQWV